MMIRLFAKNIVWDAACCVDNDLPETIDAGLNFHALAELVSLLLKQKHNHSPDSFELDVSILMPTAEVFLSVTETGEE